MQWPFFIVTVFVFIFNFFLSCTKKENTQIQNQSVSSIEKWNHLAQVLGIPTTDEGVSLKEKDFLRENIFAYPKNFSPDEGEKYDHIYTQVQEYLKKSLPKTQLHEIVSLRKFSDVLKDAGFENQLQHQDQFISLPYYERDVQDDQGNIIPGHYVDLSAIKTKSAINEHSHFEIYGTKNGKKDESQKATGTVYVLFYKTKENTTDVHAGLLTIPHNASTQNPKPLLMYAHPGDTGVSFKTMATVLQHQLGSAVVAAPSFPGEFICSITTKVGTFKENFSRYCADENGRIIAPAILTGGKKSPLDNDVNSFLAMHQAVNFLAQGGDLFPIDQNGKPMEQEILFQENSSLLQYHLENVLYERILSSLKNIFPHSVYSKIFPYLNSFRLLQSFFGPKTFALGESRGGATLLAALGRSGLFLQNHFQNFENIFAKEDLSSFEIIMKLEELTQTSPVFFSSAAFLYAPSSLIVGEFKILTQYLIQNQIQSTSSYLSLPLIPDFNSHSYFTRYIHAEKKDHFKKLNELVGWLAASDMTFLAPYVSVAVQNWNQNIYSLTDYLLGVFFEEIGKISINENNLKISDIFCDFLTLHLEEETVQNKTIIDYYFDVLDDPGSDIQLFYSPSQILSLKDILNIFKSSKNNLKALLESLSAQNQNSHHNIEILFALNKIYEKLHFVGMQDFQDLLSFLDFSSSYLLSQSPQNSFVSQTAQKVLSNLFIFFSKQEDISKSLSKMSLNFKSALKRALLKRNSFQGSIVFMHATQDVIVPLSQSFISKTALDSVFDLAFGLGNEKLVKGKVPPVGSHLFLFQPEAKFYNVPLDKADNCHPNAQNYNPTRQKCFGNFLLSPFGDGVLAHSDSAFFSSRVLNLSLRNLNFNSFEKKTKLKNYFLFGQSSLKPLTVQEQLKLLNSAFSPNLQTDDFYSLLCSLSKPTTLCNTLVDAPLFHRSLRQDHAQFINFGFWEEEVEQISVLSPFDLLSVWIEDVFLKSLEI
jgi:hypothetical protein